VPILRQIPCLHEADEMAFGVCEAGDLETAGDRLRAVGLVTAQALDRRQGGDFFHFDIKGDVAGAVGHGADAPIDARPRDGHRVVVGNWGELPCK